MIQSYPSTALKRVRGIIHCLVKGIYSLAVMLLVNRTNSIIISLSHHCLAQCYSSDKHYTMQVHLNKDIPYGG